MERMTLTKLAMMVANGFRVMQEENNKRFDRIEDDIVEIKENLKATRNDVLALHDKFVPRNEFDGINERVYLLEKGGKRGLHKTAK